MNAVLHADSDGSTGRYRVVRVEPALNPQAFGHVWVELIG